MKPCLYIVVPCYNEESVLPLTVGIFIDKINSLTVNGTISEDSKVLFINDGSTDNTWGIIREQSEKNSCVAGISLARNYGHQNALLAGLDNVIDGAVKHYVYRSYIADKSEYRTHLVSCCRQVFHVVYAEACDFELKHIIPQRRSFTADMDTGLLAQRLGQPFYKVLKIRL